MKVFIVILLLGLFPLCPALNCYTCVSSITAACNDPFNATGNSVSTLSSSAYIYCTKIKAAGIITRGGLPACTAFSTDSNNYVACCQSDLCNGAHSQYRASFLLAVSIFMMLFKFKWF